MLRCRWVREFTGWCVVVHLLHTRNYRNASIRTGFDEIRNGANGEFVGVLKKFIATLRGNTHNGYMRTAKYGVHCDQGQSSCFTMNDDVSWCVKYSNHLEQIVIVNFTLSRRWKSQSDDVIRTFHLPLKTRNKTELFYVWWLARVAKLLSYTTHPETVNSYASGKCYPFPPKKQRKKINFDFICVIWLCARMLHMRIIMMTSIFMAEKVLRAVWMSVCDAYELCAFKSQFE